MLKLAKLGIAMAVLAVLIVPAAYAGVPDVTQSFYVPQSGSITTPTEGAAAIANARRCPNDDGSGVLRFNSRLKVVVKASDGSPIAGIPASDICVLFNGGTSAQGFTGVGDDTIIANSQFNPAALCPDVRCVQADGPTDALGVAYITWLGATKDGSGNAIRDSFRKWGGYAGDIPVMVLGFKLTGRLTTGGAPGSYTAHVKNYDTFPRNGGGTLLNQGETVSSLDIAPVKAAVTAYQYLSDFDNNGTVNSLDLAQVIAHNGHRCNVPSSP
jgi:hypothetical protein